MGTVQHPRSRIARYDLGAGVVEILFAIGGDLRTLFGKSLRTATVDRQDVVFACFHIPHANHGNQASALCFGQIIRLSEVFVQVVQFPTSCIQFGQLLIGNRRTKEQSRLRKRGSRPRADGAPTIVIERAVTKHLKVLSDMFAGCICVIKGIREAKPFNRRLSYPFDHRRCFNPQRIQDSRQHIDGMGVLRANFTFSLDACWPRDDKRIADATPVGFSLPTAEGGIARVGPAPRIVVEILRPADIIQRCQVLLQVFRDVVKEFVLVD